MFRRRNYRILRPLSVLFILTAAFVLVFDFAPAWSKGNRVAELIRALRDGESKKADKLIQKQKDITAQDDYGWTPLMYAVLGGNIEAIQKLQAQGADINAQDQDGVTPLIASMIYAPPAYMRPYLSDSDKRTASIPLILIDNGANPNHPDGEGNTPLIYAVAINHMYLVEALLRKGANPNQPDGYGRTPLYFAENQDKASQWAPEKGALSCRIRMPYESSDESRFSPEYAKQVALAREEANSQLTQEKARIVELLRNAGATEPNPSRIQPVGRQRLDARPRRITMPGPNDPFMEIFHKRILAGSRPEASRYRLLVCVAPDGTVTKALVVAGAPNGISEELQKAAFKVRYQPAMKNGQPVEEWDMVIGFFSTMRTPPAVMR